MDMNDTVSESTYGGSTHWRYKQKRKERASTGLLGLGLTYSGRLTASRGGGGLTDSEMVNLRGAEVERERGLNESLPSTRAYLAKSRSIQVVRRDQEDDGRQTARDDALLIVPPAKASGYDTFPGEEDDEDVEVEMRPMTRKETMLKVLSIVKIAVLASFMVLCVILFAINEEKNPERFFIQLSGNELVPEGESYRIKVNSSGHWDHVALDLYGPFKDSSYLPQQNATENCENYLFVCGEYTKDGCPDTSNSSLNCESVALTSAIKENDYLTVTRNVELHGVHGNPVLNFSSEGPVQFMATANGEIISENAQVALAAVILIVVYVLIGFEILHRTLAAMIGSTCVLGVLSMLDKRPTLEQVVEWIDLDTICLLFGMMILVGIFSQTGFFDYSAVKAYKLARGKTWPLITLLCLLSAVISAFLDNVTTILLLTPVSIRLSQVLNLDPRPVLIAEVVFSNIGGTATAIGDPPNVIIVANKLISEAGINFAEFSLHLFIGIIFCMVTGYLMVTFMYKYCCNYVQLQNKDSPQVAELKREVAAWERTASRMPAISVEDKAIRETLRAKAMEVSHQISEHIVDMDTTGDFWRKNLIQLEAKYRITDKVLLVKCFCVLGVVIVLFFLANPVPGFELELGWTAVFGAIVLLILANVHDLEGILHKVEWATLLFFAALFVLMEGLGELGLLTFIGDKLVALIKLSSPRNQLAVAVFLIVWVSAIISAFIDNIPFTTAMIPVIVELANSPSVCLSLKPLVWSLAFGACLGGNGTLIGASANVVCAGIAEQNGYSITFAQFMKIGFPVMIVTVFTACIYLLIANVAIGWNAPNVDEVCGHLLNS